MKYNEFDNHREKPQVRPITTMDPKELGDRIEKAKAKVYKRPEQPDISQLWAREKPATEDDGPIMRDPLDSEQAKDMQRDKDRMIFHGKEIDQNSIQYEMEDYSDGIFELHGANYIDGTELDDKELEELESTDELQEWVRIDYVSEDEVEEDGMTSADVDRVRNQGFSDQQIKQAYRVLNHPSVKGGNYTAAYNIINRIAPGLADHPDVANALKRANEGFIGKKMEYNDFLQDKLDSAIQEYDTPEKKAERDALMQKYLNKGGKVEKVPTGKTAYKDKELKPAYRKDNGTPITSPGSDESTEETDPGGRFQTKDPGYYKNPDKEFNINGLTTKQDVVQSIIDNIDNNELDTARDSLNQLLDVVTALHEGGMPASIIKHKQKLAMMSDEELADRFKDFDEDRLRRMAWGHGYGKMSSHYLDRVKNHMTSKRTGTYESKLAMMLNKQLK
jgi:hypothetical protein